MALLHVFSSLLASCAGLSITLPIGHICQQRQLYSAQLNIPGASVWDPLLAKDRLTKRVAWTNLILAEKQKLQESKWHYHWIRKFDHLQPTNNPTTRDSIIATGRFQIRSPSCQGNVPGCNLMSLRLFILYYYYHSILLQGESMLFYPQQKYSRWWAGRHSMGLWNRQRRAFIFKSNYFLEIPNWQEQNWQWL